MYLRTKMNGDVGPLKDIDTDEGWNARQNWWRECLSVLL
jgi:hypothetical protein